MINEIADTEQSRVAADCPNERLVMRLPVAGAGELILEAPWNGKCECGEATGMHVGATWGKHGEAGGVMDVAQLRELADGINKWIENYYNTYDA